MFVFFVNFLVLYKKKKKKNLTTACENLLWVSLSLLGAVCVELVLYAPACCNNTLSCRKIVLHFLYIHSMYISKKREISVLLLSLFLFFFLLFLLCLCHDFIRVDHTHIEYLRKAFWEKNGYCLLIHLSVSYYRTNLKKLCGWVDVVVGSYFLQSPHIFDLQEKWMGSRTEAWLPWLYQTTKYL